MRASFKRKAKRKKLLRQYTTSHIFTQKSQKSIHREWRFFRDKTPPEKKRIALLSRRCKSHRRNFSLSLVARSTNTTTRVFSSSGCVFRASSIEKSFTKDCIFRIES